MNFIAKNFHELSLLELYKILNARAEIFILEQNINYQDMDGVDLGARHYFIEEDGKILAYLRAFYDDDSKTTVRIGRVLSITHGIGLGAKLMHMAMADIRKTMKCQRMCLDAQKYAIGFYEKFGFRTVSGEFWEEGILHVKMQLDDAT